MARERYVTIDLGDGGTLKVEAQDLGGAGLVADKDVVARLPEVIGPVETISREVLEALKRVAPTKATVELGFSLGVEAGKLFALFGKASGEASLKVILEWSGSDGAEDSV